MRKRNFLWLGTIFLLVPLLTVGCGVAQEQYDSVVADLNQANQELQSVKTELETTRAKVSELTLSLKKAETELETTQNEVDTKQAKVSELASSLEKAEADNMALIKEKESLQSEYTAVNDEMTRIKKVYPLRHFSNYEELKNWVELHFVKKWNNTYNNHLYLQEEALAEGYIWFIAYNPDYKRLGYYGTGTGFGPHSGSLIEDTIMPYTNLHASAIAGNNIYSIHINGDIIWAGLVNPKLGRYSDDTMPEPEFPPRDPYQ